MKTVFIGLLTLISVSSFAETNFEYKSLLLSTLSSLPVPASFGVLTDVRICHQLGQSDGSIHDLEQAALNNPNISEGLNSKIGQVALNVKALGGFCVGKNLAHGGTPGGQQPTIQVLDVGNRPGLIKSVESVRTQVRGLLKNF